MSDAAPARALAEVAAHFELPGAQVSAAPLGRGHIHDTFVAAYAGQDATQLRFVHQRLNQRVFPDLAGLMDNLLRVTRHLRAALLAAGCGDLERRCLTVVPTRSGDLLHVDTEGRAWRTFRYVEDSRSLDRVERPAQAYEVARAFGGFVANLADLDPAALSVTIPDFHDLCGRVRALRDAARADSCGRAEGVRGEIEAALAAVAALSERTAALPPAPARVVHNDCKANNVLLDAGSGRALCVIDLDTVMQGSVAADFGELVRTATCPSPEDELFLERMRVDLEAFRALARGFLEGAAGVLAESEVAWLPLAGRQMALENAVRFLTDHLAGDVYFRIHRPGHNLDRARAQLRLVELLAARQDEIEALLEEARRASA